MDPKSKYLTKIQERPKDSHQTEASVRFFFQQWCDAFFVFTGLFAEKNGIAVPRNKMFPSYYQKKSLYITVERKNLPVQFIDLFQVFRNAFGKTGM